MTSARQVVLDNYANSRRTCDCYLICHLRHCLCFSTKFSWNYKTVPDIFNISLQKIPVFTYNTCKSEIVSIHSWRMKSKQVRFRIFNARHINCYCSLLLFCIREINRFLEIHIRESRKILRVSRNSILEPRYSILETRASKLDSRFAKTSRIEDRVSSPDCQLTFARYCKWQ